LEKSSEEPPRRLWVCPRGFVGKDQCDSSFHASQCCGYSVPGENCGDRTEDCFCYQWNCGSHNSQWEVLAQLDNSTNLAKSTEEPPRRLWVCPRGFVGKDQCDSSFHASQCCGYSVPGENCGDRTEDCFCYQWNCGSYNSQLELLSQLDNLTNLEKSSEEPPRRLWVCPRGFVGKDQCDSSFHASQCCGYSVPGENCGDRTEDCFCYQWNCGSRRLDAGAPDGTNSTNSSSAEQHRRSLRR